MEPHTSTYILSRSTLPETLDDLCVRFILNIPEEELNSIERLSFQIEAAQWYYEDFLRDINPALPTLNLRTFISKIFAVLPLPVIAGLPADGAENAFINFMSYKTRVPVRGAIILNPTMDKLLLVKGYKKGASWSYPRGKINKDEDDMVCAIREVYEETGFDCNGLAKEEDYVEIVMRDQNLRLYIIPGVSEDTVFECQTRKEISDIKWHRLTDLPAYSKKKNGPPGNEMRTGKYYMVAPFLKDLRKWISTKGKKWLQEQRQQSLAAAANRIADETEVEEEAPTPAPASAPDPSAQLRSFIGIAPPAPPPGQSEPVAANGQSSIDEASMRLKNMFFGSGPSTAQTPQPVVKPAQYVKPPVQEDQSAKLMNMLGAGPSKKPSGVSLNLEQLEPNPRALLSMLKNGSGEPTATPRVAPPQGSNNLVSPQRSHPPVQNHTEPHRSQKPSPIKPVKCPKTTTTTTTTSSVIGLNTGWPEFPKNVPESTTHLPSPPPPMPGYNNQPQRHTQNQQNQQGHRVHQNQQNHNNHHGQQIHNHQNHQTQHQSSANHAQQPQQYAFSPVNTNGYKPPMVPTPAQETSTPLPSIPGDQAGALLSILTGATPAPQPAAKGQTAKEQTAKATESSEVTKSQISRDPSLTFTGVTHTPQQAALLATLRGSSRASTTAPGQVFSPPSPLAHSPASRSSTAGPHSQYHASPGISTSKPSPSQFPPPSAVNPRPLQYAPSQQAPPQHAPAQYAQPQYSPQYAPQYAAPSVVDRRDSVSNQQQTLLAMFRGDYAPPAAAAQSTYNSPELAHVNPASPSGGRSRSASRGRTARKERGEPLRSPLGVERQGLMAYLEGVAKMGGQ